MDAKSINELVRGLMESMPDGIKSLPEDMEKRLRASLEVGFSKLHLVTREEFEVQAAVLQRTRERLELLEKQIDQIEKDIEDQ